MSLIMTYVPRFAALYYLWHSAFNPHLGPLLGACKTLIGDSRIMVEEVVAQELCFSNAFLCINRINLSFDGNRAGSIENCWHLFPTIHGTQGMIFIIKKNHFDQFWAWLALMLSFLAKYCKKRKGSVLTNLQCNELSSRPRNYVLSFWFVVTPHSEWSMFIHSIKRTKGGKYQVQSDFQISMNSDFLIFQFILMQMIGKFENSVCSFHSASPQTEVSQVAKTRLEYSTHYSLLYNRVKF